MTKLLFTELKPAEGTVHELDEGTTIGREHCDVILDDDQVSRKHATVGLSDGTAQVEDAGSRNGTFVNGDRIDGSAQLAVGDSVRFGGAEWRYDGLPGGGTGAGAPPEPEKTVIGTAAASKDAGSPGEPAQEAPPEPEKTIISGKAAPAPTPEPEKTIIAGKAAPAPTPEPGPEKTVIGQRAAPAPESEPEPEKTVIGQRAAAAAPAPAAPDAPTTTPIPARGDVPEPPNPQASAVRPVIVPISDASPNFGGGGSQAGGASAARRTEATTIAMAILAIDAVLLVLYFLEVFG